MKKMAARNSSASQGLLQQEKKMPTESETRLVCACVATLKTIF